VAEAVSAKTGEDFFRSLVRHLAASLRAEFALVGALRGRSRRQVSVLAFWGEGRFKGPFEYKLAGTPCANVAAKRLCCYAESAWRLFPNDPILARERIEGYVGAPLFDAQGEVLGIVAVMKRKPFEDPRLAQSVLQILATRAAGELERLKTREAISKLTVDLVRSQDQERRRLGRELHDSTAQALAALQINLETLLTSAQRLPLRTRKTLRACLALARQSVREIRTMSFLLHPPMLDELGLALALRDYVKGFVQRSGIKVELDLPPSLQRLPPDVEVALFRIAQEALTNVQRHSGSRRAWLSLRLSGDRVELEVRDAGRGPGAEHSRRGSARRRHGVGLASMAERVRQLGGRFEFKSPQTGATVRAMVPLAEGRKLKDQSHPGKDGRREGEVPSEL
jgi:signal transduction histidine kinase